MGICFFRKKMLYVCIIIFCACKSAPSVTTTINSASFENEDIQGIYWTTEYLKKIIVPNEIGIIAPTRALNETQSEALKNLFRYSYFDSMMKNIPLSSVLKDDQVHVWPYDRPLTYVQNWKTNAPHDNSWGMRDLVLAVLSAEEQDIWPVYGAFLDQYGKVQGIKGANGAAGYGTPCSDVYYILNEKTGSARYAQRFENGIFVQNEDESISFITDDIRIKKMPNNAKVGNIQGDGSELDIDIDEARLKNIKSIIKTKFTKAHKNHFLKFNQELKPDTDVLFVDLTKNNLPFFQDAKIKACFIQSFNSGTYVAVLPFVSDIKSSIEAQKKEAPEKEFLFSAIKCRIVSGKFLQAFNKNVRISGAADLKADKLDKKTNDFLGGLSLYGFPVTDIMLSADGLELVQRFTKGYMHEKLP
ncbi:MAG: hypothetical protein Ta2G_13310 [Termitinemataceae bacterium]|nr:MAG: hypothetical protein Ta2G_13310 [Termitinemataceae bacterium]